MCWSRCWSPERGVYLGCSRAVRRGTGASRRHAVRFGALHARSCGEAKHGGCSPRLSSTFRRNTGDQHGDAGVCGILAVPRYGRARVAIIYVRRGSRGSMLSTWWRWSAGDEATCGGVAGLPR